MQLKKSALLVIDMQNDFLDPKGPFGDRDKEGMPKSLLPNVLTCIAKAREKDMPIIQVYQEHRAGLVDFGRELDCSKVHCIEGTWGAEIIPQIKVQETDFRVIKRRFSGFFATDLDLLLKGITVDTLYICGIAGDGCVRATAVDAHQLNYKIHLIEDAVAGLTRDSCKWALKYLDSLQQDVLISLDEF
jgi:nicotinamidase-related amidase